LSNRQKNPFSVAYDDPLEHLDEDRDFKYSLSFRHTLEEEERKKDMLAPITQGFKVESVQHVECQPIQLLQCKNMPGRT
jgi:hypothetical protein